MKKTIFILKIFMLIITAIWGMFFGILGPVAELVNISEYEAMGIATTPRSIPVMWLFTAVLGFIVPCFLVMLKLYKISAGISFAGAVSLVVLHMIIAGEGADSNVYLLYMPLIFETVAIILIAVFGNMGKIRCWLYEREKQKNAKAPSVLEKSDYSDYNDKG